MQSWKPPPTLAQFLSGVHKISLDFAKFSIFFVKLRLLVDKRRKKKSEMDVFVHFHVMGSSINQETSSNHIEDFSSTSNKILSWSTGQKASVG